MIVKGEKIFVYKFSLISWVVTLSEYLDKRELLQNPDEQARLLREVPEVIGEELVQNPEVSSPEAHKSDNEQRLSESPLSCIHETPEARNLFGGEDQQFNNGYVMSNPITTPGITSCATEINKGLPTWIASAGAHNMYRVSCFTLLHLTTIVLCYYLTC